MLKNYKKILEDFDYKHSYLYDENGKKAGAVVIVKNEYSKENEFVEGYSICSKVEPNFNKELGIAIAILRAISMKADMKKIPVKFREQANEKLKSLRLLAIKAGWR